MAIYICTILSCTGLAYWYDKVGEKGKKYIFWFMVFIPTFVSGLRGVGTDYHLYQERFILLNQDEYEITSFSLIYVLMKCFIQLNIKYQVLIFLVAFVTITVAFYIICEYEEDINIVIAVFSYMTMFFQMSFNIYRQILSSEFFLLALLFLTKKGKKKLYWLFFVIASLIHSVIVPFGIVYFLLPIIQEQRYQKYRVIGYLGIAGLIMGLPFLSPLMKQFAEILPHYAYYFINFQFNGIGLGIFRYIFLCAIPIIFLSTHFRNRIPTHFQHNIFMSILGTILWLTSYVSSTYIYRCGYIGLMALPMVHGYFFKSEKKNILHKGICGIIILFLCFFWWYDFIKLNSGETFPYQFFWN